VLNNLDPSKRLLVYLVINVVVSALTTLMVLVVWSNLTLANLPEFGSQPTATAAAVAQVDSEVSINAIIGAGDLTNERVVIQHLGDGDISLAGWRLRDSNGNEYRFPALILHPGAQVNIYTASGDDGASALYWDRSVAVWSSGEQATLLDASGEILANYVAP
jgi:hypothetical protein